MAEEIRLMRETIDQQYAEIAKLNRNIEAQNHQIRRKTDEIRRLGDLYHQTTTEANKEYAS